MGFLDWIPSLPGAPEWDKYYDLEESVYDREDWHREDWEVTKRELIKHGHDYDWQTNTWDSYDMGRWDIVNHEGNLIKVFDESIGKISVIRVDGDRIKFVRHEACDAEAMHEKLFQQYLDEMKQDLYARTEKIHAENEKKKEERNKLIEEEHKKRNEEMRRKALENRERYKAFKKLESGIGSHKEFKDGDLIVIKVGFNNSEKIYSYLTDDDSITPGDEVIVPVGEKNIEKTAMVESKQYFAPDNTPVPINKMKHVIKKCS